MGRLPAPSTCCWTDTCVRGPRHGTVIHTQEIGQSCICGVRWYKDTMQGHPPPHVLWGKVQINTSDQNSGAPVRSLVTLTSTAWGSQGHTAGCPPGITFKDLRKERPRAPALCSPGHTRKALAWHCGGCRGSWAAQPSTEMRGEGCAFLPSPCPRPH